MDTAQWPQGIGSSPQAPPPPTATQSAQSSAQQQVVERRARPVKEQALPCPRCNSTNTKFCYYNNYSLTQPRYFCKTCRRYWTEGGSLRNVPVGGGSRKNKRHSSSTKMNSNLQATTSTVTTTITSSSSLFPFSAVKPYQGQDLNLAFSDQLMGGLNFGNNNAGSGLSAMELLRSTGIIPRGLGPLGMHMSMPEATAVYGAAGFGLHDFKFPMDGNGNGMQEGGGGGGGGGGRLLFPFGDMKQAFQVKPTNEISDQDNREQAIIWSGTNLGGNGGSW